MSTKKIGPVENDPNKIVEIRVENGIQFAYWKGEKIPLQLKTIVTDEVGQPTYAHIRLFVKLVDTINDKNV